MEGRVNPHRSLRSPDNNTSQSHLGNDLWVYPRQVDTAGRPRESAPIYHVTAKMRIYNPGCWHFNHCLTMFSTMKTKRHANTPQRGTALPRIGAFHKNLPRQGSVCTSRDSHQEVSTSWDTRVYPQGGQERVPLSTMSLQRWEYITLVVKTSTTAWQCFQQENETSSALILLDRLNVE
jgi:hypothetical protein